MTICSSSPRRIFAALLVSFAGLVSGGCFTGHLLEGGRLHESLVRYERATEVGDEVLIEYTATQRNVPPVLDKAAAPTQTRTRVVAIPSDALFRNTHIAVDAFPLRRIPVRSVERERVAGRALPLRRSSEPVLVNRPSDGKFVRVEADERAEAGLRLCDAQRGKCSERFYSEALYRSSLAWWVYPLFPFAVAMDVAALPIHMITLPILVATGD